MCSQRVKKIMSPGTKSPSPIVETVTKVKYAESVILQSSISLTINAGPQMNTIYPNTRSMIHSINACFCEGSVFHPCFLKILLRIVCTLSRSNCPNPASPLSNNGMPKSAYATRKFLPKSVVGAMFPYPAKEY